MTLSLFENAVAPVQLSYWPEGVDGSLRAWDGADRLMLELLATQCPAGEVKVLNDRHGALVCPLSCAGAAVHWVGDSWLARAAVRQNLAFNQAEAGGLECFWSVETNARHAKHVLVRVPPSLPLLAMQLELLCQALEPGTPVWFAAMDKHCPRNFRHWLEGYLEQVGQFRGRYKAHVYSGVVPEAGNPAPGGWSSSYDVAELGAQLVAEAGVFAQHKLDIGARQMIASLPRGLEGHLIDLGCGTGVLGLVAAELSSGLQVTLCDESHQAWRSARLNAQRLFPERQIGCYHGDGVPEEVAEADFVLLNPPFHRGHAIDVSAGYALVSHAASALRKGGELCMVVNRHLDYRPALRRHFTSWEVSAGGPKFVVFRALR